MAYAKTVWVNDSAPALNATNLNKIEQGIFDAHVTADGAVPKSVITAAEDLIVGSAAGAVKRLGKGSDGQVLAVASGALGWAALGGMPLGVVLPYGGSVVPDSTWLFADGSEILRTTYAALDAIFGTLYGAYTNGAGAAGTTHLRLPDLRGRIPVAKGTHTEVATLGGNDGSALAERRPKHKSSVVQPTIAITPNPHGHTIAIPSSPSAGSGNFNAESGSGSDGNITAPTIGTTSLTATATGGSVGPQTGTPPLDTPAYLVLNYIIKAL